MNNIKNKIKTKYMLLDFDEFKDELKDIDNYEDFIYSLYDILNKEPGYKYYIYKSSNKILEIIKQNENETKKFKNKNEVLLDYKASYVADILNSIKNYTKTFKQDFSSQYAYLYTVNIDLPFTLRGDELLKEIIRDNYLNFDSMQKYLETGDEIYKEKISGKFSTLLTINSIMFENENVYNDYIDLFEELAKIPLKEEDYDTKTKYLRCRLYQYNTIKKLEKYRKERNGKTKLKNKEV